MRYYKELNDKGWVTSVGAGDALNGTTITAEEYEMLLVEMSVKDEYAEHVYRNEMALADVPEDWQGEVQYLVEQRIANDGPYSGDEISDEEALNIITGVIG